MEIQIDPHTLERAEERGTNEIEIKDVIQAGFSISAKYGRVGKAKVYDFKNNRHNKYYEHKGVDGILYDRGRKDYYRNSICLLRQMGGVE